MFNVNLGIFPFCMSTFTSDVYGIFKIPFSLETSFLLFIILQNILENTIPNHEDSSFNLKYSVVSVNFCLPKLLTCWLIMAPQL